MSTPNNTPVHYRNKIPSTRSGGIYKLLDAEQKAFVDSKKISATHRLRHWLKFFEKTEAYDERLDHEYARFGSAKFIMMFLGFLFVFISLGFGSKSPWMLLSALLLVTISIVLFILGSRNRKKQIDNHFRLFTMPVLHLLREEAGEDARLQLMADFSNPLQQKYAIKAPAHAPQVPSNTKQSYYQIKWLELDTELLDKTQIKIELNDLVRQRVRTRTNARGKTKTKTKTKTTHKIKLKIAFHKDHYKPHGKSGALSYTTEGDYFCYKIEQKHIFSTGHIHQDITPLLATISEGYRRVKPI